MKRLKIIIPLVALLAGGYYVGTHSTAIKKMIFGKKNQTAKSEGKVNSKEPNESLPSSLDPKASLYLVKKTLVEINEILDVKPSKAAISRKIIKIEKFFTKACQDPECSKPLEILTEMKTYIESLGKQTLKPENSKKLKELATEALTKTNDPFLNEKMSFIQSIKKTEGETSTSIELNDIKSQQECKTIGDLIYVHSGIRKIQFVKSSQKAGTQLQVVCSYSYDSGSDQTSKVTFNPSEVKP